MVGVSADKREVQQRFVDKYGLTFPMVPDPEKRIIGAFGAQNVLGVAAVRSTFLVDPDGLIAKVWPKAKLEGHAEDVVAAIRSLSEASAK